MSLTRVAVCMENRIPFKDCRYGSPILAPVESQKQIINTSTLFFTIDENYSVKLKNFSIRNNIFHKKHPTYLKNAFVAARSKKQVGI